MSYLYTREIDENDVVYGILWFMELVRLHTHAQFFPIIMISWITLVRQFTKKTCLTSILSRVSTSRERRRAIVSNVLDVATGRNRVESRRTAWMLRSMIHGEEGQWRKSETAREARERKKRGFIILSDHMLFHLRNSQLIAIYIFRMAMRCANSGILYVVEQKSHLSADHFIMDLFFFWKKTREREMCPRICR